MSVDRSPFHYQGHYLQTLRLIHTHLVPRAYMEIGVDTGASLARVRPETLAVGIDPQPRVNRRVPDTSRIFTTTSDEFFATRQVDDVLDGRPLDVGFIDGMHHFEFALRDFRNMERSATPDSIILIHDCLPPTPDTASRDQVDGVWAGDVWKLVLCLADWRPDLVVNVVSAGPTGVGVVSNLDPSSRALLDREQECVETYAELDFAAFRERARRDVRVVPNEWRAIREVLPRASYQRRTIATRVARARARFSGTRGAAMLRRARRAG